MCAFFFVDIVHDEAIDVDEHGVGIVHDGIVYVSPLGVEDEVLPGENLPREDGPVVSENAEIEEFGMDP